MRTITHTPEQLRNAALAHWRRAVRHDAALRASDAHIIQHGEERPRLVVYRVPNMRQEREAQALEAVLIVSGFAIMAYAGELLARALF